jgi:hypothetical protein
MAEYSSAWKDYRWRCQWFFGIWLGGFLVVALLGILLAKLSLGDFAFYILGPAWIIAFVVVALRLQFFKCPRCSKRFFCTLWFNNPFAKKCAHCGLPKWSEADSPNL